MTKTFATAAAILGFAAAPALAETMVEDTDANGTYSMEELVTAYPGLTEEVFIEIDTDDSGDVSEDELTAAVDEGLVTSG
ncbi:hypothetical protein OB2597_03729 [Pseudooceanicola batsensis HTCC2597]|uniref:EF-hand domain-containing protein n=1 Tax=Pseudooceanicola batsensis (strain ATCC BAA-863 / DSM 15984 / KCTC 12145 / HTCC2597) TaxID=252305 RepID=A3U3S9_PSEBH|nr:hypothetical protein [Pseudooceanicola batsensis]EAQ01168.1 hypothetical protein OB2597_03729 [Pseudooceanicola batsensis HTCC2597]